MSHAIVLVIGDDIGGQLAPYDENLDVERYKDRMDEDDIERMRDYYTKEGRCAADAPPEALVPLLPEWSSAGGIDEDGLFVWSTANPQAKWDWWQVGGRWAGALVVKPAVSAAAPNVHLNPYSAELAAEEARRMAPIMDGRHTDRARKGDVDWAAMSLRRLEQVSAQWDDYEAGKGYFDHWLENDELLLGRDAHLLRVAGAHPLYWVQAVVAEGVWREKGRLGWFGFSTDGPEDREQWVDWFTRFMVGMPDEAVLTVVDYHI